MSDVDDAGCPRVISNDFGLAYYDGEQWQMWWYETESIPRDVQAHLVVLARAAHWAELRATLMVLGAARG